MKTSTQKFVWGSAALAAALTFTAPAHGQESPTLLLLDANAIRSNVAPNQFAPVAINATIADVGVRDALPYFNVHEGQAIALPGGTPGHEGWYAFSAVPGTWSSSAGDDGLENFVWAGPGLGSPDAMGSRTTQLGTRAEVIPLGMQGLQLLTGRTVCAVAYLNELPRSATGVSLSGANLGVAAFRVTSVSSDSSTANPIVQVQVLETREVCGGALAPMADAPAPGQ